jgi:hypothetical protein
MSERGEDDFGEQYEVNSRRAHLSAYVLVAGLVLELVNAVVWYEGPKTLAEMAAVLLIVGGVWGEVFFGHKARIAGDTQLAQYEARTAEATARAEEARLELARLTTPRVISDEQRRDYRGDNAIRRDPFHSPNPARTRAAGANGASVRRAS